MKRGQVTALPITYIFIAVIAAIILLFGAKVIKDFYSLSTEAKTQKELQNLQNDIKKIYYLSKGSSQSLTYSFPATISEVCFRGSFNDVEDSPPNQIINNLLDSNIFLFEISQLIKKQQIDYLIDPKNPTNQIIKCFSTQNGRLNIILQNEGNYVSLTKV